MSVSLLLFFFSVGILAASYLPNLPPLGALYLLIPGLFLVIIQRKFIYPLLLILGVAWGIYAGHRLVANQLDTTLEGQTLQVSGWVVDIPESDSRKSRFLFQVDTGHLAENNLADNFPRRLQLSWYLRDGQEPPAIIPGDYWQLQVRVKRPRGFVNPGGFDYQAWLLRRGIGATGYVLSGNKPSSELVNTAWITWVDKWRWQLQQWVLANCTGSECGILVALLIGDTSHVDKSQWLRMQQTGTSHLIAISGLHVGFLAIVGYWIGLLCGRLVQLASIKIPAQRWAYSGAIIFAAFYSALAGFNIPTLRTLIMLAVFYLSAFWYRAVRLSHVYLLALALVLLIDPLAACDMGFWLSFGAVGVLLVSFSGRYVPGAMHRQHGKIRRLLSGYTRAQWVLFVGLLVPLGLLTNSSPLLAPVANFVAIPLVTFFVVPCLLLGASLSLLGNGQLFVWLAEQAMEVLKFWLDGLFAMSQGEWALVLLPRLVFGFPAAVLLILATFVLLLPRGLFPKWLGYAGLCVGLGAGFLPKANPPALALSVMDVGQGTAIVVSTPNHHLVYDTGPRYSADFDAGSGIVLPYLRSQAIHHLDAIVVSHSDMDHAGGFEGLSQQISFSRVFYGEPPSSALNCHEQIPWQWDDVNFRFLQWPVSTVASANDHSCVLLIEYADQRILLPGDIESESEWALLRGDELPEKLTLLLAAHHGSRTSSNPGFVAYTQPEWVVFSAGYKNQHGHPHPQIQQRFNAGGSRTLNTAIQGAVHFRWWPGQDVQVRATRQQQRRYWYEPMPSEYVLP